jgi:hypothetical protein
MDEKLYTPAGEFEKRTLASVMAELRAIRQATAAFVEGLPDGAPEKFGGVGSRQMTVRALLYLMAGHERHHVKLIRERYMPHTTLAAAR